MRASRSRACALRAGGARAQPRMLFAGLDLRVGAGERWVVVGPNGAGKSSLLAALAGVVPIAAGTVRIDGRALAAWAPVGARRAARLEPAVLVRSVSGDGARDRGAGASPRCRLARRARPAPRPAGRARPRRCSLLAELADSDVQTLSGGERQRVALATALLQDAPLLLLDEPASHLDLAHQRLLVELLLAHADSGGAVVASLHDLDLAWDLAEPRRPDRRPRRRRRRAGATRSSSRDAPRRRVRRRDPARSTSAARAASSSRADARGGPLDERRARSSVAARPRDRRRRRRRALARRCRRRRRARRRRRRRPLASSSSGRRSASSRSRPA